MDPLVLDSAAAVTILLVGLVVLNRRDARYDPAVVDRRRTTHPAEFGLAGVVALGCLTLNVLAALYVAPLARDHIDWLALAQHDKQPSPALLALAVLLLILASAKRGIGRVAVVVFAGAAIANVVSPLLWDGSVPDYILLRRIDVIANASDVLMVLSGIVIVVETLTEPLRYRSRA